MSQLAEYRLEAQNKRHYATLSNKLHLEQLKQEERKEKRAYEDTLKKKERKRQKKAIRERVEGQPWWKKIISHDTTRQIAGSILSSIGAAGQDIGQAVALRDIGKMTGETPFDVQERLAGRGPQWVTGHVVKEALKPRMKLDDIPTTTLGFNNQPDYEREEEERREVKPAAKLEKLMGPLRQGEDYDDMPEMGLGGGDMSRYEPEEASEDIEVEKEKEKEFEDLPAYYAAEISGKERIKGLKPKRLNKMEDEKVYQHDVDEAPIDPDYVLKEKEEQVVLPSMSRKEKEQVVLQLEAAPTLLQLEAPPLAAVEDQDMMRKGKRELEESTMAIQAIQPKKKSKASPYQEGFRANLKQLPPPQGEQRQKKQRVIFDPPEEDIEPAWVQRKKEQKADEEKRKQERTDFTLRKNEKKRVADLANERSMYIQRGAAILDKARNGTISISQAALDLRILKSEARKNIKANFFMDRFPEFQEWDRKNLSRAFRDANESLKIIQVRQRK